MGKTQAQVWEIMEFELNKRGTLTIPSDIREKYNMTQGDKIKMGLLQVEGETQQERNWRNRDRMIRTKFQNILQEEKTRHDDEHKARSKAFERLEEEYFLDE